MSNLTPNINQFGQTTVQGQMDLQFQGSVISCQVDAAQATALIQGQAVKLATTGGGVPKVLALASNSESAFGFVARNLKDANFAANAPLEIAMQSSVMYMTAGAAITRGAKIEVVNSTIKVITNAGTNPVAGFALDKAAADGDLIRVFILTPSYELAQNIADIAGLQAALNALGNGAKQVQTALTTVGAGTITAAGIVGGNTQRSGPTAEYTDTTAIASLIAAALPNLAVNDSFYYTYQNNGSFAGTLVGGTGVTISGQTIVQPKSWARFLLTYTGTNTFTMVQVASGPTLNYDAGARLCSAQVDKATSTAFSVVTGCSVLLEAGAKYILRGHITGTSTANGGAKATMQGDGTLSATSFSLTGTNFNGTTTNAKATTTTLGNAVGAATAVMTDIDLEGAIVVNVGGVLSLAFAQNASHSDTSSAYVNSWLEVERAV
jgi:hypothetical protein